jgi:asparagine synthase (glutamine-hydrolysing)
MCGIAGVWDPDGVRVEEERLRAVARSIRHRGPDDAGSYTSDGVGLVAVRLAVLDVTDAAHQPMASDDGRHVLVYNGELYNFRELKAELEALGHQFRSRGDTEVVLRAFVEWGPGCIERFNGMFAFAVWDDVARELFLARDRWGIKPLYYAREGGRVLFASEVKAMLELGYAPRVSPAALGEYFTFQNIYSDRTLFEGVHLLPAGHTLIVSGRGLRARRYWDLQLEPEEDVAEEEWICGVRETFENGVTRQLVSDVPVGSFLSGGMDSASIAAVATRSINRLMTFTGGFDLSSVEGLELIFDERTDAETVASRLRTEHYEMVMHAGDMAWVLPELVWHIEDLRVGMSYQNHYIARLASKFVKVALAGSGGDELFAGYPWRYDLIVGASDPRDFDDRYYAYWTRLVPDAEKHEFFTRETWDAVSAFPAREAYDAAIAPARELDPVARALYFEAKTFLHGILVVDDKISMAHGLEARVPFLDNALVDVARRIPSRLKHADPMGKRILRRAMEGLLPPHILDKRKQGFSPPDQSWYRGPTMDYIQEILLDERALSRGHFNPDYVRRMLSEHISGRVNHRLLIWSLLSFEWWNRLFIDGEAPARHGAWHGSNSAVPHTPTTP